jgi:hypothetical protein
MMRTVLVGLTILFCGCSSGTASTGTSTGSDAADDVTGPEACVRAGGQCLIGGAAGTDGCPVIGPQDCNPAHNPGGAICCLPSSDASTASCHWAASLDDAGPGGCVAARAVVKCTDASGAGCGCLSDDPTRCPGCGPDNGFTCEDACTSGEYAVSCGGIAVPTTEEPPAGCRSAGANPGGFAFYCCPCE